MVRPAETIKADSGARATEFRAGSRRRARGMAGVCSPSPAANPPDQRLLVRVVAGESSEDRHQLTEASLLLDRELGADRLGQPGRAGLPIAAERRPTRPGDPYQHHPGVVGMV